MGNYGIILSLLGCIDHGLRSKKLVDRVVDSCKCQVDHASLNFAKRRAGDQVTNLREDIFLHRIRYSLTTTMNEEAREAVLNKAIKAMEK